MIKELENKGGPDHVFQSVVKFEINIIISLVLKLEGAGSSLALTEPPLPSRDCL
jgi:hypothetical protein